MIDDKDAAGRRETLAITACAAFAAGFFFCAFCAYFGGY